ncbi:helix-turn-helix transcriptional regulator [Acinetobacter bereziniae]|uniref:helix-turn-helix domain-containing protein n=1 Tax=Acinetobacter bereziniae TaxID=106648 RepID=UPI0019058F9B|nr:helix-turn-helix transcriptional regulator [Acinetobacter bereziniae]MDG3556345.1 helix-turn-helix transcriptional regulator [Acinetobacter bereziniae]MDP6000441.1 helix-turn-helix transcriptional regulator [Acinetobacter bereziniae]QQC79825.1 helix-turn-helix transcriptional regulator [Acinetobacter bereziniae]UUN92910.1 helix-turn-helix domain-containing protein [Acinetobacter bereziniae]WMW73976.1 helix-turn-helix transcriptional regulator [Acinetobacter bereziniae]
MNQELAESIGSQIRKVRKQERVSQEQLALLTGIDRSYLGRIERGEVSVTVEKLAQIAHVLNVDIKNLIP